MTGTGISTHRPRGRPGKVLFYPGASRISIANPHGSRRTGMKTLTKAFAVAALTFGAASAASAGTTSVNFESSADKSVKKLGSYTGTATYDDVAGLLTISINNTSAASGAALTGLAFNVVGDGSAAYHDGDVAGTKRDEDLFDDVRGKKGK